jgi:TrmH family RNA methyltransferase
LLEERSARRKHGAYVIEGPRLLADALATGQTPTLVLYTPDFARAPAGRALLARTPASACWETDPRLFASLADTVTPQGVLAVVPLPEPGALQGDLVLVLDQWRDPGNLGTALRTAPAAGIHSVVLTRGTVDVFSPKVVRAAMGGHFRLALQWDVAPEALAASLAGRTLWRAVPRGGASCWQVDWRFPAALIVAGETTSLASPFLAAEQVTIPMAGETESLNAAIATAVLCFAALQQRTYPNR